MATPSSGRADFRVATYGRDADAEAPVRVDLYVDATCPWSWATSRWVRHVADARPLDLRWHVMCLAVLNEGEEMEPEKAEHMRQSRRAGRLCTEAVERYGPNVVGPLFEELGRRVHEEHRDLDATVAAEALAALDLDDDLVEVLESETQDEAVRRAHAEGEAAVGESAGTPVVAVDGRAFFGPVLTPVPRGQEALDLFDGVRLLAGTTAFREMSRSRPDDPDLS